MEKLSRSASGLRHLRWAREIHATLEAHYEHNGRLSAKQRELVLEEAMKLRTLVSDLSSAVKPYRDFLERRRVQFRGMQRVGRFLCEEARGRAGDLAEAEAIREGFDEALAHVEARERLPLEATLEAALARLRDGLTEQDRRLAAGISAAFVDSLYPALVSGGAMVADAGDRHDDATAKG